jgi:hypothetical protein
VNVTKFRFSISEKKNSSSRKVRIIVTSKEFCCIPGGEQVAGEAGAQNGEEHMSAEDWSHHR